MGSTFVFALSHTLRLRHVRYNTLRLATHGVKGASAGERKVLYTLTNRLDMHAKPYGPGNDWDVIDKVNALIAMPQPKPEVPQAKRAALWHPFDEAKLWKGA